MINRLPEKFRLPATNGTNHGSGAVTELPKKLASRTAHCIASYPIAALSVALLAGLVVGRLVKR